MAVAFQAAGTAVATTTTNLALVAPTIVPGDILFALIISNNNTAVVAPAKFNLVADTVNTAAMRTYLGWMRAGIDDSAATFNFTVAGTTLSFGVLVTYRGVRDDGSAISGFSSSANGVSDNVTYATLNSLNAGLFVAFGAYNLSATTAGAFSGTSPTFSAARVDAETATGNTASLFVHDGQAVTGLATGSRTLATASITDAINHGYMVELVPFVTDTGGENLASLRYPRLGRIRSKAGKY